MSFAGNPRIVISCVSFETVMIVDPIRHYRADGAYLLHKGGRAPYDEFLDEVKRQLEELDVPHESLKLDIYRFTPVMREVHRIIRAEKAEGNHICVNVGAGPQMFCAAALVACMMEGISPFDVGTRRFTVEGPQIYFRDGRPVGLAAEVHDPFPLPEFEIRAPDPSLVEGPAVWKRNRDRGGIMSASAIVTKLGRVGLLHDVEERRGKVRHGAVMRYRRNFLEPWVRNGWLRKEGRRYALTERGEIILEIFGGERYG